FCVALEDEEITFLAKPAGKARPRPQQCLVRDLGNDAPPHCALPYHYEPPRMFSETTGERPFRIGTFVLCGLATHRLAFWRHAGELKREQAAQRFLLLGMVFEEPFGAAREHTADVGCFYR